MSIVSKELKNDYCILRIKREPVNSMNLELWQELMDALDYCESKDGIRGIIIISDLEKSVFTAGNDLMELYPPNTSIERYSKFWTLSNQFLSKLYESPLCTIAAIDGYCPAGGTCLAMCCDIRIASESVVMGLNEAAIGILGSYKG